MKSWLLYPVRQKYEKYLGFRASPFQGNLTLTMTNWESKKIQRPLRKSISRGDMAIWTCIAFLVLIAVLRFTVFLKKTEPPTAGDLEAVTHFRSLVGDIFLKHGELLVHQHTMLHSVDTKGVAALTTYMPKPPSGDPYDYDIEMSMLGQSLLEADKKTARSGEYVRTKTPQILPPGDHSFTLVYRAKNVLRSDGKETWLIWPASSQWKIPIAAQVYHIKLESNNLPLENPRILYQAGVDAEIIEWPKNFLQEPLIQVTQENEYTIYTITIQDILPKAHQVYVSLRWPRSGE